jgi:hypothetical protein
VNALLSPITRMTQQLHATAINTPSPMTPTLRIVSPTPKISRTPGSRAPKLHKTAVAGTPDYLAPELLLGSGFF